MDRQRSLYDNMITRCTRPSHQQFKDYGGRGIRVCAEWMDKSTGFNAFREWMEKNGYSPELQLDRRETDGDYTPTNCRFVTRSQNQRNRRDSATAEYDGRTWSVYDLADREDCAVNAMTLKQRLAQGWDVKRAMAEPARWNTRPTADEVPRYEAWGVMRTLKEHAADPRCTAKLDTIQRRIRGGMDAREAIEMGDPRSMSRA